MPGAYARTATQALANVTFPYIQLLADLGLAGAVERNPALRSAINVARGSVTHPAIAEAHHLPLADPLGGADTGQRSTA